MGMTEALFCWSCFGLFQLILSHRTLLNQPKPADFSTSRTSPEDSPHALEGVCCIELNFLASAFMNLFHARQRVGCGTGMNITEDSESATEQEHLLPSIRLQYMMHAWSHGSQGKLSVFDVNDN